MRWAFSICVVVSLLSIPSEARRKKRYSVDPEKAEEVLSQIRLEPRLYTDQWLQIIGRKKKGKHQIKSGETLWGISQAKFGSPKYWRKLWQVNPTITNPHEVEVGRELSFFNPETEEDVIYMPFIRLKPGGSGANTELDSNIYVQSTFQDRYRPRKLPIDPETVLGEISGSYSENETLVLDKEVFVRFFTETPPEVDSELTVVRFIESVGGNTKIALVLGDLKVTGQGESLIKVEVTELLEMPKRGDKVIAKLAKIDFQQGTLPPDDLEAKVLWGEEEDQRHFVEGKTVIIDRGSEAGLGAGQRFRVLRDEDLLTNRTRDVLIGYKGEIQILFTGPEASLGYIVKSKEPIEVGDILWPKQKFQEPPRVNGRDVQTIDF